MNEKNVKSRYWTLLLYQENLLRLEKSLEDFEEDILKCGCNAVISPLHNQDGDDLKPHYHVILVWSNVVPFDTAKFIADLYNSPIPVRIASKNASTFLLYLTHESPKSIKDGKHIYDRNEIKYIGCSSSDFFVPNNEDSMSIIVNVTNRIRALRKSGRLSFTDLLEDIALDCSSVEFGFVVKNAYLINILIRENM